MKHIIPCITLMVALQASAMDRDQASALATSGQVAYAAGDHQAALAAFDSVAMYYNSAALQLNIGNCWYKLGDVAHAILHYERGLRLAPGDADLQANLDLANEQVKDRVTGLPMFSLGTTWNQVRGGHDPDQWARRSLWASAIFFSLLAFAFVVRVRGVRLLLQAASALAGIFLVCCVAFASTRHQEAIDDSEAIIMTPKVDVRGEPKEGGTVLFVLHKGTKITVLQGSNGWFEVRIPNGNVGWMPSGTLERI